MPQAVATEIQSEKQAPLITVDEILDMFKSQKNFVDGLTELHIVVGIIFAVAGVVYILYGWKVFKTLVILNAAILGAVAGSHLGALIQKPNMVIYMAVAGGLIFATLAWPTMKFAVSIMGALAGSVLGYGVWKYVVHALSKPELTQHAWAGALIGLVVLGMLAFILFRVAIIAWTSFQGSMMCVMGVLSLLLKYDYVADSINDALTSNIHLLPLLVAVPTGFGFIFQDAALLKKEKKKKKKPAE
ncbi:MAG TPA: DUF4203 domain-containing protein [Phycisphaerae bacterium]|nr:DUF4203 domain-containing protein [Phycisphaerae bacterium]